MPIDVTGVVFAPAMAESRVFFFTHDSGGVGGRIGEIGRSREQQRQLLTEKE